MADVIGPCPTLPGRAHPLPEGATCDTCEHERQITVAATHRIQGETDSMGAELNDMCDACYAAYKEEIANADTSGCCEWCSNFADKLVNRRDFEEGMSGRLYLVCAPCIKKENDAVNDELENSDWCEPAWLHEIDDREDYPDENDD